MKITNYIINYFIALSLVKETERELYCYCFNVFLSKAFFIGLLLSISIILDRFLVAFAYYVSFSLIRYSSGGYHTNSIKNCLLLSLSVYLGSILLISYIAEVLKPVILIILLSTDIILIYLIAPIDHPNKCFSPYEKERFQKESRRAIVFCSLCAVSFLATTPLVSWAITTGCQVATVSLVVAKYKRR